MSFNILTNSIWFVNTVRQSDAYIRQLTKPSLILIMACHLSWRQIVTWTNADLLLIRTLEETSVE